MYHSSFFWIKYKDYFFGYEMILCFDIKRFGDKGILYYFLSDFLMEVLDRIFG